MFILVNSCTLVNSQVELVNVVADSPAWPTSSSACSPWNFSLYSILFEMLLCAPVLRNAFITESRSHAGKQVFYDKFSNGTYVYLLIVRLYGQQIFYDKFLVF